MKCKPKIPIRGLKAVGNDLNAHTQRQRGSQMEHAHMQEIEKTINGLKLPGDCKWFKQGFGFSCKAKDIGLDSFVECLEKDSCWCPFSVSYGCSSYCKCPSRIYIARELKK